MSDPGRAGEPPRWERPPYAHTWWPADRPLNFDQPARVPVRPQGRIPVIVRLLWPSHEELVPAVAIRWTSAHFMVLVPPLNAPEGADELVCWLRSDDVYRTIPRRPRPLRPAA